MYVIELRGQTVSLAKSGRPTKHNNKRFFHPMATHGNDSSTILFVSESQTRLPRHAKADWRNIKEFVGELLLSAWDGKIVCCCVFWVYPA
jgi:hypothetical protein